MMSGKITAFHQTVRGHLHILRDIPCEDYSVSHSDPDGQYHLAVVADGHGSRSCMRSAYGSRMAVVVAADCLKTFAESLQRDLPDVEQDLSTPRTSRQMMKQLTDTIISRWHRQICQHLEDEPLTEEELSSAEPYETEYRAGKHLDHVYGTTLIAALWVSDYLFLLQQGDGRCDVFYADGSVDQPIPWDQRCFQNVTTSLCDEDVAVSIRHCILPLKDRPVIACYLGSDGVEDSYHDMEGTHTFYRKLSGELARREPADFDNYLVSMLPEFSEKGSGDDVSVAGLVDIEAVKPLLPLFERQSHRYELLERKEYYDAKIHSMTRKHGILKKRTEDAEAVRMEKYSKFQTLQSRYPNCLGIKTQEDLDAFRQYAKAKQLHEAAEREFGEYDSKYQELLKARQDIEAQIQELPSGETGTQSEDITDAVEKE